MIRVFYFLALFSLFSHGSMPDIERHSFDIKKLQELGFTQIKPVNNTAEEVLPYIFVFPNKYTKNFTIQTVTLTVFSKESLLFSTLLQVSDADIKGYSSSYFYIKDASLTYELEVMYDSIQKESPFVRKGHIIEIKNFLTLPVGKISL